MDNDLRRPASTIPAPTGYQRVLLVDNEVSGSSRVEQMLRAQGFEVLTARDPEAARLMYRLCSGLGLVVVLNLALPDGLAMAALQAIRELDRDARVIAYGACNARDVRGVTAVLPTPLDHKSVSLAMQLAATKRALRPRRPANIVAKPVRTAA
jgi:DNA-binding NtrC family response regulator